MKSAPITLYHLEGSVRPSAVRWLTNRSIVVCRTSGTLELQPDYNSSTFSLLRTGFGIGRLQRIPESTALFAIGEGSCEVIRDGDQGLTMRSGDVPAGLGAIGSCVISRLGRYVLASRDGALWTSSDSVAWSFAGKLTIHSVTAGCALSNDQYVFGSARGEVELVTLFPFSAKGRQRLHGDAVQDIFVLDECIIGTVSRDRALRVWDTSDTLALLWSIADLQEHFINCAAQVGDELWTGSSDGTIAITSLTKCARLDCFRAHSDSVRSLDLSQDGTKVLSLSDDATYNVYDTQSKAVLKRNGEERQYIRSGDFLLGSGGARAAFGSTSGFLYYGKIEQGSFFKTRISAFSLRAMRHLNRTQIICGDEKGVLRLFDTAGEHLSVWASAGSGLTAIRINPRDQRLLCGYRDGSILVFFGTNEEVLSGGKPESIDATLDFSNSASLDPRSPQPPLAPSVSRRVHESIVGDLLPRSNGLVISCSDDQTIKTLVLDSLSILNTTSLDGTAINNLLVLSELLVATTDGGLVFVLDATTHEVDGRYAGHSNPVRAISKISDSLLATGDRGGEVRIWNVHTRQTLSVNAFRERVIELGYEVGSQRLYVITEAEVASLQLNSEWLSASDQQDVLLEQKEMLAIGENQTQNAIVDRLQEQDLSELKATPLNVTRSTSTFDDVEINKIGRSFQLSPTEDRLLRSFTRWRGGTRCDLGLLSGGLSGANVFRAKVFDHSGATRVNAVAKIGSRAAIQAEADRYDTEVSRLSPHATPRRLEAPDVADGNTAGVFYSLAEGYDRSQFEAAIDSLPMAPHAIDQVRDLTAPWRDHVPETRATIADIRQRFLDDISLGEIAGAYSLDWVTEFEQFAVQVRRCTIHGDLHGGNILVDQKGVAIIIDYGEVGDGSAPYDPITLELSYLFHPDGPLRGGEWPRPAQAKAWRTEDYLKDCPMPEISRACWRWADAVCAGHREIAAGAYAFLIRQLKYPDTKKDRILDLLIGVRAFFQGT
jgi:WD40 repeat protein